MRRLINGKLILGLLALSLLWGCKSEMEDYYEEPGWLKGSTWEVLESSGNYKTFLNGIERAGLRQMVDGKSILTVMAPSDAAFKKYFTEKGISGLGDMSDVEVSKLIGFHLMYYSYNTDKLINFRPEGDGITDDKASVGAGMFYKHRTKSQDTITTYVDTASRSYKIYHNERFLPVFSYRFFNTMGIDAKTNYEYFFPNTTWTGDASFNVANANWIEDNTIESTEGEKEVKTGNGYLYAVDQVLEPLETIYTELKDDDNYTQFLKYYNKESYVFYDEEVSREYGNGDSLYYFKHNSPLVDIACEWPVIDYSMITTLASQAYTVFAPSNDAINNFYDSFWAKGGYSSLDEVNSIARRYMLYNCITGGLAFPESIKNGDVLNAFATAIDVDVDNVPVANRSLCSNGMLYKLPTFNVPVVFQSVTGPVFQNKDFTYFLSMLDKTDMAVALASEDTKFTMLVPRNEQIHNNDYELNGEELTDPNNEGQPVSTNVLRNIVNMHITPSIVDLTKDGVYETNTSKVYWFVKDGKLTTSALFNQIFEASAVDLEGNVQSDPNPYLVLTKLEGDWTNGNAYVYEYEDPNKASTSVVLLPAGDNFLLTKLATQNDKNYKYYEFTNLLKKSGLSDGTYLYLSSSMFFIPTNEAIRSAIALGKIPGLGTDGELDATDEYAQQRLAIYMYQYSIPMKKNGISKYPYLGSGHSDIYENEATFNSLDPGKVRLVDNGSKLSISSIYMDSETASVDVVDTYNYFPFSYSDGCAHIIKDVLDRTVADKMASLYIEYVEKNASVESLSNSND